MTNSIEWISIAGARASSLATKWLGKTVEIRGWVRTRRDSKGGFSFLEINDGTSFGNLQVVAPNLLANYESEVLSLSVGSSVIIQGVLKESPGEGQSFEMEASSIRVTGHADPLAYPLQKKRHTFEKLREWAHLRPRTNTFGAVTRVRNRLSYSTHQSSKKKAFSISIRRSLQPATAREPGKCSA